MCVPRAVRDAALECLQEIYRVLRGELLENLKRQNIRSAMYRVGGWAVNRAKFGAGPITGQLFVVNHPFQGTCTHSKKARTYSQTCTHACTNASVQSSLRATGMQEVIARLNVIAPTDIIVPDGPPSGGSNSSSG
eukprot:scaffold224682_cov22-Tisochrysis_lutea.AAC.1